MSPQGDALVFCYSPDVLTKGEDSRLVGPISRLTLAVRPGIAYYRKDHLWSI